MAGLKRLGESDIGPEAKRVQTEHESNQPTTTEAEKPLISLELINGKLSPVEPTSNGFRYVSLVRGPGDRDKCYDLTRIIVVHPGQPEETLECSIKIRVLPLLDSLGNHKKIDGMKEQDIPMDGYVALSYAWEDQTPDKEIRVRHPDGPLLYRITSNLKSALVALRHTSRPRCFWADAISVDQDNDLEKSQQLPLMSRIYTKADKVCVWLSDKEEFSYEGPSLTKKIRTADAFQLMRKIRKWQKFGTVVEDETKCEEWLAFIWLMRRPWFERRWVVQEIVLATQAELRCGAEWIDWTEFAQAVSLFEAMEDRVKKLFRNDPQYENAHDKFGAIRQFSAGRLVQVTANVISRRDDGRVVRKNDSLESLISTLVPFQAGDPKDIVYAILSLAKDVNATAAEVGRVENVTKSDPRPDTQTSSEAVRLLHVMNRVLRYMTRDRFPVDYSKEFDEICLDLYTFTCRHSGSLDLINRPWCPKDETGRVAKCSRKLPTWVRPARDFAWHLDEDGNVERVNADPLVSLPGNHSYQASGKLHAEYKFGRDGPRGTLILSAGGFRLDLVSNIEGLATAGVLPASWHKYKIPKRSQSNYNATASMNESGNTISTQFWKTMVAGKGPDGQSPPLSYPLLCQEVFNTTRAINLPAKAKQTTNPILKDFINRVLSVIWERKLARTSKHGCLALLPESTEPGDVICILYGCSVPVVLRETSEKMNENESIWELIGECYMYDMMMGEALVVRQVESQHDPIFYQTGKFNIR